MPVITQSPLGMVPGMISLKTALPETSGFNKGVPESAALPDSKVVISNLPILIGAGH